jgi:shikimate kinase
MGKDKNIVLIGYRAVGKTTAGQVLSQKLDQPFVDLDSFIEEKAGKSIPEIVDSSGWEHFRDLEKKAVDEVSGFKNAIIATGGGVVLDEENVTRLRSTGILIWLKADIALIEKRLGADQSRPSLTGNDTRSEAAHVLEERLPLYEKAAHFSLDVSELTPPEIAAQILKLIRMDN